MRLLPSRNGCSRGGDLNSREIDYQYRRAESIVPIEDIRDLMKIFNIGKIPLSPCYAGNFLDTVNFFYTKMTLCAHKCTVRETPPMSFGTFAHAADN